MTTTIFEQSPLGKKTAYVQEYAPQLLMPIPRQGKRDELELATPMPFKGIDLWNGYELSWLNSKGKPIVALAGFIFPCESSHLVESKSFKLYLNSFNATTFSSLTNVENILRQDLSKATHANVLVNIKEMQNDFIIKELAGTVLDDLDISCTTYLPDASLLTLDSENIEETLCSHLLKSNCLVTGQPDWGSVQIQYRGKKINHASLLRYIVSYRNHNGFAEHCTEKMFVDILKQCKPEKLTICTRYTRRGGLDINPIRSTETTPLYNNHRSCRQ